MSVAKVAHKKSQVQTLFYSKECEHNRRIHQVMLEPLENPSYKPEPHITRQSIINVALVILPLEIY